MKKDNEPEFEYNARGAKVYHDPMRHKLLEIPNIHSRAEKGAVYEILSAGTFWKSKISSIPNVTINENGTPILYRLPEWFLDWVNTCQFLSSQGTNPFPSYVEFGYVIPDKQYYAEMLNE
jgi:hypothetical protein